MLSVAVWLGLNVTGKVAPETVNPVPMTVTKLTVTAAFPVEDRVTDCVAGDFKVTSPKAMLLDSILSVGTEGPSCRAKVSAAPLALAVSVTV
jgi:hypothetical protein